MATKFPFKITKLNNQEGEYEIIEKEDAYKTFWLPKFQKEYIPKFLVSNWLLASKMNEVHYVAGFQLMPNPWHSENGPGEHAGSKTIIRWIAWYIPPRYRLIIEESLSNINSSSYFLTCLSRNIEYNKNVPETFDDETISDLPSKYSKKDKVLYTVRDLRDDDLSDLQELRRKAISIFIDKYGVEQNEIEMYFHYPVKIRLSLLHLHVCIGHRETGLLKLRSHSLEEVICSIEKKGKYIPTNGFRKYYLNYSKDGSLAQILSEKKLAIIKKENKIDVIIPCDKKDLEILPYCVKSLKENCSQIRRTIVISKERFLNCELAEWFDEAFFHFSIKDIKSKWRYQQLIKLCAAFVIPNLLDNILVVDADTIWKKKNLLFLDADYKALYSLSTKQSDINGYIVFRKEILKRLNINHTKGRSAIAHHMLFQKKVLASLFTRVKKEFDKSIWEIFSKGKPSEYELYFNYAITYFPNEVAIRNLECKSISNLEEMNISDDCDYYVCHSHNRFGKSGNHDNGDYLY